MICYDKKYVTIYNNYDNIYKINNNKILNRNRIYFQNFQYFII